MNVITKDQCTDRKAVLAHEIRTLESLVRSRRQWLENPLNKMKTTHSAIAADTREMERELDMLKKDLRDLNQEKRIIETNIQKI